MQSIFRAMKRGNAEAYITSPAEGLKIAYKKGTPKKMWRFAEKNSVTDLILKRVAPQPRIANS